jgi:hypothetical protein
LHTLSLALRGDGVGAVDANGKLATYDAEGKQTGETTLSRGAAQAFAFADAWLARVTGATHLAPSNAKPVKGKLAVFADGESVVTHAAVAVDGVAVARTDALELWTHAGKLRWSVQGAWVLAAIVPGHVIALSEDGSLAFASMRDGTLLGTLHLASPEPASTWKLTAIDANRVVLGLGDWLVWIDVATRKTIRRVRARDAIKALTADAEWVVCGTETGWVQAFAADSGEPTAQFEAEHDELTSLALGKKALFTGGVEPAIMAFPRSKLEASKRAPLPITALAAHGTIVATGDASGHVRILANGTEIATRRLGEAISTIHIARGELVVAATARVVLRLSPPWEAPRPLALRTPATAIAADEDYVFAGTDAGTVDVYELASAHHITSYSLSDGEVTALARLPGRFLVVGTGALDGRVFVIDVGEAKVLHRLEPHDDAFAVTCLACDRRGRIVASGSDDGSIALLDPVKGKVLARVRVRETPISLAFDATGRTIACVFADGTANLVKLGPKGVTLEDIHVHGAQRVAWGEDALFGYADGRVEHITTFEGSAPVQVRSVTG